MGSSTSDLNTKSLSNLQNRVEKRQPPAEREESCEVTKQNEGLSIDFGEVGEHPKTEALAPATSEQITFPVLRERNIGDESLTEATGLFKENEALLSNVQGDHSTEELPTGKTNTEVSLSKKGNISQNPIQNTELIKEEKNVKGELSRKLVKYSDTDTVKSEAVTSASAVTQSSSGLATAVSFDKNIVLVSIIKSPDNKTGAKGNTEQINTVVCKPESVVIPKGENDSSEEALKETQNKPSKCVIITKASSDHRQTTKDATSGPIKNTSVNVPRIIRIKPGTLPFKLIKTSESQKTIGISGSKSSTMSGTTLVTNPSIAVGSQKVLYTSIQGSNVKGIVYLKSNTLRANDPNSSIDNTSGTFSEENKLSLSENQSEALSSQLESKVDDKVSICKVTQVQFFKYLSIPEKGTFLFLLQFLRHRRRPRIMVSLEYLPYYWKLFNHIWQLYILGVGKFFYMHTFDLRSLSRSHDQKIVFWGTPARHHRSAKSTDCRGL